MKNERLLAALTAFSQGDFSVRLPEDGTEIDQETAAVFNAFVTRTEKLVSEVNRIAIELGEEGRLGGQADVEGVSGQWAEMRDHINQMGYALTFNIRGIGETVHNMLDDDLKVPMPAKNEVQRLRHELDRLRYQLSHQVKA